MRLENMWGWTGPAVGYPPDPPEGSIPSTSTSVTASFNG